MAKEKHVRIQLDSDGKIVKFYKDRNGKACLYVSLESPKALQLAAYHSILNDVETSLEYFKLLTDSSVHLSAEIRKAVLISAIMTYCRCFTDSEGRRSKIDETVYKGHSQLLTIHQKLMSLRHTHLAHCGASHYEQRKVVAIMNPDLGSKKILLLDVSLSYIQNIDKELPDCISLTKFLDNHAKEKIEQLYKLVWEEANGLNVDDLYSRSIPFDDRYLIYMPINDLDEAYKKQEAILDITEM